MGQKGIAGHLRHRNLRNQVETLARIQGWLLLESPPDVTTLPFPYHLSIERLPEGIEIDNEKFRASPPEGTPIDGEALSDGEQIQLVLEADTEELGIGRVYDRHVYLFIMQSDGTSNLIFPPSLSGSESLRPGALRAGAGAPAPFRMGLANGSIQKPFGQDTWVLLTSRDPLPDPRILAWGSDGRTRGTLSRGGMDNDLARLIFDMHTGTRSPPRSAFGAWSVQRVPVVTHR